MCGNPPARFERGAYILVEHDVQDHLDAGLVECAHHLLAPGLVRTPLAARLVANEASLEASEVMHALGRIGEPDDLAA